LPQAELHKPQYINIVLLRYLWVAKWLVSMLDLWSKGCEFDSRLAR